MTKELLPPPLVTYKDGIDGISKHTEYGYTFCPVAGCRADHVPNLPLLRKVLDAIRADPMSWNQADWATNFQIVNIYDPETDSITPEMEEGYSHTRTRSNCGTSYCIAGHVMAMSGQTEGKNGLSYRGDVGWEKGAQHLLGLTNVQADLLFAGDNDWSDVLFQARAIAQSVGEKL